MTRVDTKRLVATAVLAAVSSLLMAFSFPVPLMPAFIKMDFSELPAVIAAFTMGPMSGVAVCLVKNAVNVFSSTTSGVGELCNFLLGALFVLPAGIIYRRKRTRAGALVAGCTGALIMAVGSLPINYFITYPIYANFMPMEGIMGMYRAILPSVKNLWHALIVFNMPFTFLKGVLIVAMTWLVYKPLERIINR